MTQHFIHGVDSGVDVSAACADMSNPHPPIGLVIHSSQSIDLTAFGSLDDELA